jgi:anti-sigma regulatory factor (Ser/Thr protein kinase)
VRELTLHLLDIAENSIAAGARNIKIQIEENINNDLLKLVVSDDGRGMSEETVNKVIDPFVTSRTTRKVGLGIPLLKEAAEACNGSFSLTSTLGKGTELSVQFQRSHIDRMPLGDVNTTFQNLFFSNPLIHWIFEYRIDEKEFVFDDRDIKAELQGVSLTEPEIIRVIRELFESGLQDIKVGGN